MKKVLVFIGIILLVGALTNPSLKIHKRTVNAKMENVYRKRVDKNNPFIDFGSKIIKRNTEELVKRDNYLFFSITKYKNKTIGVGAINTVFLNK